MNTPDRNNDDTPDDEAPIPTNEEITKAVRELLGLGRQLDKEAQKRGRYCGSPWAYNVPSKSDYCGSPRIYNETNK